MFTPEGYWSFTEICEVVPDWTRDIITATRFQAQSNHLRNMNTWKFLETIEETLVAEGYARNRREARFAIEVCEL